MAATASLKFVSLGASIVTLSLVGAPPAAGQRIAAYGLSPVTPSLAPATWPAMWQSEKRRTYWVEGGIIGGVLTGAIGMTLSGMCPANSGSCPSDKLRSFVMGAVPGFIIGGLIGDTIEKGVESPP